MSNCIDSRECLDLPIDNDWEFQWHELGVRPNTVGQWCQHFALNGIKGLHEHPCSGKPAKYGIELRDRALAQLELAPPAGMASWDGGSLGIALGVSDDAV